MYILKDVLPIGRFRDDAAAHRARDALGIESKCWFVYKTDDLLQLGEPEMRLVRAALQIKTPVADLRAAATALRDADPVLSKRIKSKAAAADLLMKELDAHDFGQGSKRPKVTRVVVCGDISKRRGSFRATLNAIAAEGSTIDELIAALAHYPAHEVRYDVRRALALSLVKDAV